MTPLERDCPDCRAKRGEACWVEMPPIGWEAPVDDAVLVDDVWTHRARLQEDLVVSDTDQVFAQGLAAAEESVAMIGLQLIALGGLPPPVPEKATAFGRFVAVELAKAHVAGSTVQIAEFTDRERQRVAEMLDLAARSRQETTDLSRLTEETRRNTQRSAKTLDDLFSRITRLEETSKATRCLAQDLLFAYRRLTSDNGRTDPDLVLRAAALGLDVVPRQEAP